MTCRRGYSDIVVIYTLSMVVVYVQFGYCTPPSPFGLWFPPRGMGDPYSTSAMFGPMSFVSPAFISPVPLYSDIMTRRFGSLAPLYSDIMTRRFGSPAPLYSDIMTRRFGETFDRSGDIGSSGRYFDRNENSGNFDRSGRVYYGRNFGRNYMGGTTFFRAVRDNSGRILEMNDIGRQVAYGFQTPSFSERPFPDGNQMSSPQRTDTFLSPRGFSGQNRMFRFTDPTVSVSRTSPTLQAVFQSGSTRHIDPARAVPLRVNSFRSNDIVDFPPNDNRIKYDQPGHETALPVRLGPDNRAMSDTLLPIDSKPASLLSEKTARLIGHKINKNRQSEIRSQTDTHLELRNSIMENLNRLKPAEQTLGASSKSTSNYVMDTSLTLTPSNPLPPKGVVFKDPLGNSIGETLPVLDNTTKDILPVVGKAESKGPRQL